MIIGDMPPYEAFPIGGTNSVRGYSEGGAGTGRNFVSGTAELHVPVVSPIEVMPPCHALLGIPALSGLLLRACGG